MSWRMMDLMCKGCNVTTEELVKDDNPNCPQCSSPMTEKVGAPGLHGFDSLGRS